MGTAAADTHSQHVEIVSAKLSSRRGLLEESRRALVALTLAVGDWTTLCVCFLAVWLFRTELVTLAFPSLGKPYPLFTCFWGLYFFAPWLVTIAATGLYSRHTGFWDEVRAVVRASIWGTVAVVALSFFQHPDEDVSRTLIASLWLVSMPALVLVRHRLKRALAAAGLWRRKVLVVGTGEAAVGVARGFRGDVTLGYDPIALITDEPADADPEGCDLPVLGPYEALPALIEKFDVRDIVIAIPEARRAELSRIVALCNGRVDSLRFMPDTIGFSVMDADIETVDGHMLISMRSNLARPTNLVIKRITDIVGSVILLVPATPVLLAIALLIRLDSRGPALYVQQRVGFRGRLFPCFKFRTMFLDADQRLEAHLTADPAAREQWQHYKKLKDNDPRVTRVGRVLRRLSLDELPQLLNVLRGEMSLVGPRPYIDHELAGHDESFQTILLAWPGITGLWQVSGRNELTMMQRLRLDEFYVRNWSLWLDLQILLRTFGALMRSEGAY